jgi:hypothetical protein
MAGVQAEEVTGPRDVRAYGLRPGIGSADANGLVLDYADEVLRKVAWSGEFGVPDEWSANQEFSRN